MENVILITIDSLRADHLGCLGYSKRITPNLDNLAEKSITFKNAFATGPTTQFSFPSIIASLYPLMLDGIGLPEKAGKTIAEILKDHGFATAAFHSNPYLSKAYNYHRGFETFRDPESWSSPKSKLKRKLNKTLQSSPKALKVIKILNDLLFKSAFSRSYKTADEMTKEAISWIENHDNKFFLWLHYMDVHHPYFPHNELIKKFGQSPISTRKALSIYRKLSDNPANIWSNVKGDEIRSLLTVYDSEIRYTDQAIGTLIQEGNIDEDTIVIITSDHGEEFGEHNGFHCMSPYNEMLHVPLILKAHCLGKGIMIDQKVSLIDIAPTVIDLLGFSEVSSFQGKSMVPIIEGGKSGRMVISEYWPKIVTEDPSQEGKVFVIQDGTWKLINREGINKELYNLQEDQMEKNNILSKHPQRAKILDQKLTKHLEEIENPLRVPEAVLNENLKQRLEDLGYL